MDIEIEDGLKALLGWWDDAGVDVPTVPETARRPKANTRSVQNATSQTKPAQAPQSSTPPVKPVAPPRSGLIARKAKTLEELEIAMQGFDAGTLSDGARQCVFARGNPEADIMVIGECPGVEEDMQGKPFIGRSGQLLDKMLGAIGLSEDDVYITYTVNWRPTKNRNPKAEEIELCRPFLHRHIELVVPKFIVMVGDLPLKTLTGLDSLMKQHGQWQDLQIKGEDALAPIPAMPLYHPSFLLRQPALKKDAWRDLLSLKAKIDAGTAPPH